MAAFRGGFSGFGQTSKIMALNSSIPAANILSKRILQRQIFHNFEPILQSSLFSTSSSQRIRAARFTAALWKPSNQQQNRQFSQSGTRHNREKEGKNREGKQEKQDENDEPEDGGKQSFGARLKMLIKKYGYAALAVYLGLSAIDLPICFVAVRTLGTDRIGRWEHIAVSYVKNMVGLETSEEEVIPVEAVEQQLETAGTEDQANGLMGMVRNGQSDSSGLWTQFVLAYAIHKSLIFIRVPIAAAILPKFVKTLRAWGWKVGGK